MSAGVADGVAAQMADVGTDLSVSTVVPPHAALFGGSGTLDREAYGALLDDHCAWAERLGVAAMLIYEFWQALDPWTVAAQVLARTRTLEPIVAVLPAVSHPAEVARRLASLSTSSGGGSTSTSWPGPSPATWPRSASRRPDRTATSTWRSSSTACWRPWQAAGITVPATR